MLALADSHANADLVIDTFDDTSSAPGVQFGVHESTVAGNAIVLDDVASAATLRTVQGRPTIGITPSAVQVINSGASSNI